MRHLKKFESIINSRDITYLREIPDEVSVIIKSLIFDKFHIKPYIQIYSECNQFNNDIKSIFNEIKYEHPDLFNLEYSKFRYSYVHGSTIQFEGTNFSSQPTLVTSVRINSNSRVYFPGNDSLLEAIERVKMLPNTKVVENSFFHNFYIGTFEYNIPYIYYAEVILSGEGPIFSIEYKREDFNTQPILNLWNLVSTQLRSEISKMGYGMGSSYGSSIRIGPFFKLKTRLED